MTRLTFPAAVRLLLVAAVALAGGAAQAGIIYNQNSDFPGPFNALTSQSQGTGGSFQTYDNFTLSAGATIQSLTWQGFYWNPSNPGANPPPLPSPQNLQIGFFNNSLNLPGTLLSGPVTLNNFQSAFVGNASFGPPTSTVAVYNFSGDLAVPFAAAANTTYWLSIVSFAPGFPREWLWTSGTGGDGKSAQQIYGQSPTYAQRDRAFSLSDSLSQTLLGAEPPTNPPSGTLANTPEPGTLALAALGLVCVGVARFRRK